MRVTVLAPVRRPLPRGSDQETQEIRLSRRDLREPPPGWSPRTQLVLIVLAVVTVGLGSMLGVRALGAQGVRAEGAETAAALTAARDQAQAHTDALLGAITQAEVTVGQTQALAEALDVRVDDLTSAAVEEVAAAGEALSALVTADVPEVTLPDALTPGRLPGRYVAASRTERAELADRATAEISRLEALGAEATTRIAALAEAQAAVSTATGVAARAAATTAVTTLATAPEATVEARAQLDEAVAALAGLGAAPAPDTTTREAFLSYFAAADAVRISHQETVAEREAAEREAAEREAAEREAAEREAEAPWWQWWSDRSRGPGRD